MVCSLEDRESFGWQDKLTPSSILNLEITICGLGNCELGETNYYQWLSSWCRQWDPTPKHSLSHLLALSSPTLLHIYTFICVWDTLIFHTHALHLILWKSTTLKLNNLNDSLFCPILWTGRTICKLLMWSQCCSGYNIFPVLIRHLASDSFNIDSSHDSTF